MSGKSYYMTKNVYKPPFPYYLRINIMHKEFSAGGGIEKFR
jgi:hypothetical protein